MSKKSSFANRGSQSGTRSLIPKKSYLNGDLSAKRVVVKADEVETKTQAHYLNPRNQEALTLEAVADIYDSILVGGVDTEGVAVEIDGKYLILDSSRRRFCCIKGRKDLPLWVIEGQPTVAQLLKIINNTQEVKKWSYYEHGKYLLSVAESAEIDVQVLKVEELAEKLGIGRETLRKRLEAVSIDDELRKVFVDYEGIPNTYYSDLSKIQKKLTKAEINIAEQICEFKVKSNKTQITGTVSERQKQMLFELKEFVDSLIKPEAKAKSKETKLGNFPQKHISARRKESADGKKTVYEFKRIPVAIQRQIDQFIEQVLPPQI